MYKLYYKENNPRNILYWKDENGNDWYDYADTAEKDTVKVLTDINGMVVSFHKDATMLSPTDCDLHIFNEKDLPEDFALGMNYFIENGKLLKKEHFSTESVKDELFKLMLKDKRTAKEEKRFKELKEKFLNE